MSNKWYNGEMVVEVAEVLEQYDFEPPFSEGAATMILDSVERMVRKLLAEQYDAGYEFALRRVRESAAGLDPEVDYALDALELAPKK